MTILFVSLGVILLGWIVIAQSCMKYRISDRKAIEKFSKAGVSLQTKTVLIEGFPMHYAQTGNDTFPTLFFVHGSPASWSAFEQYLRDSDLLQKFRMIAIDRPGFGYSNFGKAKDLEEQSKLISAVLPLIKNEKPVYIIGHSLGGSMSIRLAIDNPGFFSGIVLLAASVDPAEERPEKWRPILYKTPLHLLVPGAMAPSNKELWLLKKDLVLLKKELNKVSCPVWIIHGDKDPLVPVGNAYFSETMMNVDSSHVKIIHGANHFILWPPWYNEVKPVLLQLPG